MEHPSKSGPLPPRSTLPAPAPGPEFFIETLRLEHPALIQCPPGRICVLVISRSNPPTKRPCSRYSNLRTEVLPS